MDWLATVVKVIDGDSAKLQLTRGSKLAPGWSQVISSDGPVSIRLIIVDTPERGEAGWVVATGDTSDWLELHKYNLMCETLYLDNFGRLLGDIYEGGNRGNTLSQYLLKKGYPPYVKGR